MRFIKAKEAHNINYSDKKMFFSQLKTYFTDMQGGISHQQGHSFNFSNYMEIFQFE